MRMLIVNPIAWCGYALKVMEQVQSVLTARNLPFRVMRTEYPGYAAKLAREAVEMGCEAVYVIGGDGTFSEAARGLAGSGIPICPDAVPNDGEIDFMVVGHQPRWKVPYYLVRMMMKQILNFPFTEHVLCDKVTVSSPGMHVEVDGEIIACEHAEFTMHPGALMLYW